MSSVGTLNSRRANAENEMEKTGACCRGEHACCSSSFIRPSVSQQACLPSASNRLTLGIRHQANRKNTTERPRTSCVALAEKGRHFLRFTKVPDCFLLFIAPGRAPAPAHARKASEPDRRIIGTYTMRPSMDRSQVLISRRRRRPHRGTMDPMDLMDLTAGAREIHGIHGREKR